MATFFIDTTTGQVATGRQLVEGGVANGIDPPPRPWHPIQGSGDASTMWYAVLRKRERGVFIGTLVLRHGDHHASLLQRGWQEVAVGEIGLGTRLKTGPCVGTGRGPSQAPHESDGNPGGIS